MLDTAAGLDGLNENQRLALETSGEPVLVLAGPGSGKTRVLTLRVARLIEHSPEKHFRVLGLTFTSKAAAEMRTRVGEMLGLAAERALLTTFHSFAADVLRQHGSHIRVRPDFTILTQEADRQAVLLDAIAALEAAGHAIDRADVKLLPLIDNLLAKLVPPADVEARIREPELASTVAALYRAYREQLVHNNQLDFATLLCFSYELVSLRPAIAQQLRTVYPFILVDEFQDTNYAQFELLRALIGDDPTGLFVVADDDQIIYQWNGANPERLQELRRAYDMHVVQLPTNYRCPPSVIHLANALISHNHEPDDERTPLIAGVEHEVEDCVLVKSFRSMEDELAWLSAGLAAAPASERGGYVVLARTRRLLETAQVRLEEGGVHAVLALRKGDFESAPLRWLVAMLRLCAGRGDREALRVAGRAFFELEGVRLDADDVVASAAARGGDLLRSFVEEALARPALVPITRDALESARDTLVERLDYRGFIEQSFEWFGAIAQAAGIHAERAFVDYEVETDIWHDIRNTISTRYGPDVSLFGFLQELDLAPKAVPIPPGAVRCFTIHNAKGMEFPHVHLIGLVEDQLPSYQAIQKGPTSRELMEERRNCFVAITRTRERLTLTFAQEYFGWPKRPSRFLGEMGLRVGR